jgi:beta-lactamase superfamily II metal-dependent hydrolase
VGHHGSKSSTRKAFLDAVSPKVSVISSGPYEYRGVTLPDPEVVAELEAGSRW